MSRELTKMNLIAIVQQLPKEDIEVIETYIKMIERENKKLKEKYLVKPNRKEFIHDIEKLQQERNKYKELYEKEKEKNEKAIKELDQLEKNIVNDTIIGFKQFIPAFNKIKTNLKGDE